MAVFRRVDGRDRHLGLLAPGEQLHHDRRGDLLGDDQEGPAALLDQAEEPHQLIARSDLVVGHEDIGIVEHRLHALDVRHHVVGQVASLERHAFDDFERRFDGIAEFDRDDAMVAGAFEGLGHHVAQRLVVGRDGGDGPQALGAVEALGRSLQRRDRLGDGLFEPFHEFDRVGARRKAFQPALHEHVGQDGRGRGAVARDFVGLFRHFAQHLCAHVLEGVLELDLARDTDAVARHDRRPDRPVDDGVHAPRPERAAHRTGQLGDTPSQRLARLVVMQHDIRHHGSSPVVSPRELPPRRPMDCAVLVVDGDGSPAGRRCAVSGGGILRRRRCTGTSDEGRFRVEPRRQQALAEHAVEFGVDAHAAQVAEIARQIGRIEPRALGVEKRRGIVLHGPQDVPSLEIASDRRPAIGIERQFREIGDRQGPDRLWRVAGRLELLEHHLLPALVGLDQEDAPQGIEIVVRLGAERVLEGATLSQPVVDRIGIHVFAEPDRDPPHPRKAPDRGPHVVRHQEGEVRGAPIGRKTEGDMDAIRRVHDRLVDEVQGDDRLIEFRVGHAVELRPDLGQPRGRGRAVVELSCVRQSRLVHGGHRGAWTASMRWA